MQVLHAHTSGWTNTHAHAHAHTKYTQSYIPTWTMLQTISTNIAQWSIIFFIFNYIKGRGNYTTSNHTKTSPNQILISPTDTKDSGKWNSSSNISFWNQYLFKSICKQQISLVIFLIIMKSTLAIYPQNHNFYHQRHTGNISITSFQGSSKRKGDIFMIETKTINTIQNHYPFIHHLPHTVQMNQASADSQNHQEPRTPVKQIHVLPALSPASWVAASDEYWAKRRR